MLQATRSIGLLLFLALAAPAWAETKVISESEYPGATAAQQELDKYYNELLRVKEDQGLIDHGFGAGFADGHAWMQGLMSARDKADAVKLPYQLKEGYTSLINLGQGYMEMRRNPARDALELDNREEALWNDRSAVRRALDLKIE